MKDTLGTTGRNLDVDRVSDDIRKVLLILLGELIAS